MRARISTVLISFLIVGAALAAASQQTLLTGTISYRERMALSPAAVVEVQLEDVTRADAAPSVVARTSIANPGQVPVRFNLDVDMTQINRNGRYALRATIKEGATTLFASMDTVLVLTQGHGSRADLVLTRVGPTQPKPVDAQAPPPLPANLLTDLPASFVGTLPCADCEGIRYHLNLFGDDSFLLRTTRIAKPEVSSDDLGSWTLSSDRKLLVLKGRDDAVNVFEIVSGGTLRRLAADGKPNTGRIAPQLIRASAFRPTEVRALMRGAYTYMADAATFVECSTGQRWPVAAEGASRELEAAYLKARSAPGAALIVELDGLAVQRAAEAGGPRTSLVVERVRRLLPKETCPARFASAPLTDTYWRLTHLGDRPVPAASDPRRELSLTFLADGKSFHGSSGCNRLSGSYSTSNAAMTLTSGGTMVACKAEAKTEAAFMDALKATHTYRIVGRVLELTDSKGAQVARFEARLPAGITRR